MAELFCEIALRWMTLNFIHDGFTDKQYIGSDNDLVSSSNKSLPETMLTKSYGAIWHH